MTATLETLDGLVRRLTLTLNVAEIEAAVGKRLQRLTRTVKMDGFRPGKAPLKMVAARFGGEVRGEVIGEALQRRFAEEVTAQNLNVAGYPRFAQGQEPGSFVATFEVYPEIVLGDLSQVKLTRPSVEVTDADVDRTLDVLRKQRTQFHNVERESREGDRVHVDYSGTIDGQPFPGGEAKDFPVMLGEGRTLKDFEGALVGMKAGESKTFDVAFPEDYFAKELAGKTATFQASIKSVQEARLPEVDDDFARSMGVHEGGPAKLREEIAVNLRREARRRIQAIMKERVIQTLLETNPFPVPGSLVMMECQGMMERAKEDLKARGMKEQDIKLSLENFEPQARRRVAGGLLFSGLASAGQLKAEADQVRALVEEFAESYEDPSEVVAWYYQDTNRLREVEALVLEDNIVNWVIGQAQIADEVMTLEKLMGNA